MSILQRFRSSGPHLAPELDDRDLGRVCKQLDTPPMPGLTDIQLDQIERLIRNAGTDWDRRSHRFSVIAESVAESSLARSWLRRRPNSADALILQAWAALAYGRRAGVMDDARAAAEGCYRAADIQPNDPTPWLVLIGILRLVRCDQKDMAEAWNELTARDAWNREAHLQMLGYLSPEECGSHGQVLDFVDNVRYRIPAGAPAAGLELTAVVDQHHRTVARGGVDALMARKQWTQARAQSALDRALADWTKPGHLQHAAALADLNLLAYALVQAKRLPEAEVVFQLIGRTVTPWPWRLEGDPVRQFAYWQAQALR
ncbi:hypothetical protein [Kitasatospora mediocidica]|uniref:hypothetical protein n=1 Tax=Kitasatospora mediocidica TaxID=58352 RepID=UPI00055F9163|nr:hypothetical protein [Kitasatospora mediocidica]